MNKSKWLIKVQTAGRLLFFLMLAPIDETYIPEMWKTIQQKIEFLLDLNLLLCNKADFILDIKHLVNGSPDWSCLL